MEKKEHKHLAHLKSKAKELKSQAEGKARHLHAKAKDLHQKHIVSKMGPRVERINEKNPVSAFTGLNRFLASFAAKKSLEDKKAEEKMGQEKKISVAPVVITTEEKNHYNGIITETHGKDVKISSTQLKRQWIFTDYDKVLAAITVKGVISATELAAMLHIEQNKLRDYYLTLEKSGAIRVEYPLVGSPKLISISYEKNKKREAAQKRGEGLGTDEYGKELIR